MGFLINLVLNLLFSIPPVRLILFAVVPGLALFFWIRKKDRLEPEPPKLLWTLFGLGALSILPAMVLEPGCLFVLSRAVPEDSLLYRVLQMILIVGFAEEGCKYLVMRRKTWRSAEFNCFYDAVVYSTAVSAGFAVAENILYGVSYGTGVLTIRALTSIPGHICFGVMMGGLYGAAKKAFLAGDTQRSRRFSWLSVVIPALVHGGYDLAASRIGEIFGILFILYLLAMYFVIWYMVRRTSENDHRLTAGNGPSGSRP